MTIWTKDELLEALAGEVLQENLPDDLEVDEVVIDSRKQVKSGLFIALKGEKNDGHDFIEQATANGCKTIIINRLPTTNCRLPTILVSNTFSTLNKLAAFSRKRSHAKIIALTGSVGKTGTKDMLELVFATQGKTFATKGNLNNHIGLPLTLANFPRDCDYGIFEMGMNHAGEIEPLARLTQPHLALITNVHPVHIEFFKNEQEIAAAKAEIFSGLAKEGIALLNSDNLHYDYLKKRTQSLQTFSFGKKTGADYQILNNKITAKLPNGKEIYYQLNSLHPATINNSIIAVACLDLFGKDLAKGLAALKNLESKAGRGKINEVNGIAIIDETYNASLPSMRVGLEYARNIKEKLGKKRIVAALGDMLELGEKSADIHEKVINSLAEFGIDFAVLVGEKMSAAAHILPENSFKTFPDSLSASLEIQALLRDGDVLYVKGSHGMKMDKIIEKLLRAH
ncbi:MAG: UDP-N-acetylmuramoyl-tripeptide--D-alanyl-D-alanine ligase [Alphaproteobacteria bacterium]|nr:UDP-N-acetylmuramoyl-tripeptide--D-alanyl-D-alanine ligase [Alphaproteobacteria bacterium]